MQPGDIVAFETSGTFGVLIGWGQWLRRADRADRRYHHVAVVIEGGNEPTAVQAARKVDVAYVDDIASGRPYAVFPCPEGVDRAKVVAQAEALVGDSYGVLSIVSIAVDLLTPAWFPSFRRRGTYICSALGAWCLHSGGYEHPWPDVYQVTPADLVGALSRASLAAPASGAQPTTPRSSRDATTGCARACHRVEGWPRG